MNENCVFTHISLNHQKPYWQIEVLRILPQHPEMPSLLKPQAKVIIEIHTHSTKGGKPE